MGLSKRLYDRKLRLMTGGGYSIKDFVPPRIGPNGLEMHIPPGNYIGPRTDIRRRLREGVKPTTYTDAAAKQHDIAYHNIGARLKRGAINRQGAYQLVKQADNKLMRSAVANKMSINPVEHLHANAALAGMAGKKLLQSTGLMDELKYIDQNAIDELTGGLKKRKSKKDKLKGLRKRFKTFSF